MSYNFLKSEKVEREFNFNDGWKFKAEYIPNAQSPSYSLSELRKWENVNLPHTVRVEKYSNSGIGGVYTGDAMYIKHFPIPSENAGKKIYIRFEGVMGVTDVWVNGVKMTAYLASETGDNTWYGGYLPFVIDITDVAVCDGETENIIVVYANSRNNPAVPPGKDPNALDFSYFGGIYRSVTMTVTDRVHITDANYENIACGGGILVDFPEVSKELAQVYVKTHVRNENINYASVFVETELVNGDGMSVAIGKTESTEIKAGDSFSFEQTLSVSNPKLWSINTPNLCTLVSRVYSDGVLTDTVKTRIGIRKIEMHRDFGLKINGEIQPMLSGVNRHQEYAYIGYAAPKSLQRRDAMKFKECGINVVRTGHYPQSPDFLDACDELGILVIEPTPGWQWYNPDPLFSARVKNDIRQMVRRDRNRPCILAYETVLNETSVPAGFTLSLAEVAKEEHPSAKVATENSVPEGEKDTVSDIMYMNPERSDFAVGFQREYGDSYREQYSPENFFFRRVFRGTGMDYGYYPGGEGAMFLQAVKRLMGNQNDTEYFCPVDASSGSIGGASGSSRSYLNIVERYIDSINGDGPAFIGGTSWIGIDHNRTYSPDISACGLWDLLRLPKFSYYAMASQRPVEEDPYLTSLGIDNGPMVFIASFWTKNAPTVDKTNEAFDKIGTDDKRIILVYSNTETVKLSVVSESGEVLWEEIQTPMTGKNREYINAPFEFSDVPYIPGSHLEAEGYDSQGALLAEHEVYTASAPAKVTLSVDTMGMQPVADGSDTVMVYAYIRDAAGVLCTDAYNTLKFTIVSGDATIVGDGIARVGANPVNAEAGIFGVYVKMGTEPSDIVIRVESEGLESSEIVITSREMTEPVSPCYLIAYTGDGEDASNIYVSNLTSSDSRAGGTVTVENLRINKDEYKNSIVSVGTSELVYNMGADFNRISGAVAVDGSANEDAQAVFKIYVDSTLVYMSNVIKRGETEKFDVDIPNGEQITLRVCNVGQGYKNFDRYIWLSPVLEYGKSVTDESELYTDIALGKPTEASSTLPDSSAAYATDGNDATVWIGELVGEGENANEQYLIVDLGESINISGAKVGVLHDSITYKYEIQTSSDKLQWNTAISVAKTGQANNIVDKFSAENVRYVKILFTEIGTNEDREQYSNATLTDIQIYKDMGVDSVLEYNLKHLGIDGKDIVFSPYKKEYTIVLQPGEQQLKVHAAAFDPKACIKINGTPLDKSPFAVTKIPSNGEITVSVTAANKKGHTEYKIKSVRRSLNG